MTQSDSKYDSGYARRDQSWDNALTSPRACIQARASGVSQVSDATAFPGYEVNNSQTTVPVSKQRAFIALGIIGIIFLSVSTLSYVFEVVLLLFAGEVLAVLLHTLASALRRLTDVRNGRALAAVVLGIVAIISVIIAL